MLPNYKYGLFGLLY